MILAIATVFLALAEPQDSVIDRAGRMAESFWTQFTAVQCTERIVQNKLRADGKVTVTRASEFDYVAFLREERSGLSIEESRVARSAAPLESQQQLLLTSGFPALLLMFHPEFRGRFVFEEGSADEIRGGAVRVAFKSKPEAQSMSGLKLKDRVYPILWKGTAWLDPTSGAVRRIEAALAASMDDIGLADLRVEVEYAPASLAGAQQPYWLPTRATISVKTLRQEWRNVHEFSQYKRFAVSTSTSENESK
jgi:hypothetical protein